MQQQRRFAWRGRALERFAAHADDGRAPFETREHLAQREGSRDRVELVAALYQPWRRRHVVVGAERDHENVRVERSSVGHRPSGGRVDGSNRGLHEIARPA